MANANLVTNLDTNLRPTRAADGSLIADQTLTVSSAAVDMIATALNDRTTHVFWTVDGADARFTFDGTDPSSTVGHYAVDKDSGIWQQDLATSAKWIRQASTDVNLHISELSH